MTPSCASFLQALYLPSFLQELALHKVVVCRDVTASLGGLPGPERLNGALIVTPEYWLACLYVQKPENSLEEHQLLGSNGSGDELGLEAAPADVHLLPGSEIYDHIVQLYYKPTQRLARAEVVGVVRVSEGFQFQLVFFSPVDPFPEAKSLRSRMRQVT